MKHFKKMKDYLTSWVEENQVVWLTRLNNKASRTEMVGRILKLDMTNQHLLFYDDDLKTIHTLHFNEIDEIMSVESNKKLNGKS